VPDIPAIFGEGEKRHCGLFQLTPVREETTPMHVKGIRIRVLQTEVHCMPHRNQICFSSSTYNRSNAKNSVGIDFTALHLFIARS